MNGQKLLAASVALVGMVGLASCVKQSPTPEQQCSAESTYDQIVEMLARQIAQARDDNAGADVVAASSIRALKSVIRFQLPTVADTNSATHKVSCEAVMRLAANGQQIFVPRGVDTNEVAADHVDVKIAYALQPAADDGRSILLLEQAGDLATAAFSASLATVRQVHEASAPPAAQTNGSGPEQHVPTLDELVPPVQNSAETVNQAGEAELGGDAKAFAAEYFSRSSGSTAGALAWMAQHYADRVNFFGSRIERDAVLKQKSDYMRRWPVRSYSIEPDSLTVQCDGEQVCRVTGIIDWATSSAERNATTSGKASFDLVSVPQGEERVIIGENSRVISRSES